MLNILCFKYVVPTQQVSLFLSVWFRFIRLWKHSCVALWAGRAPRCSSSLWTWWRRVCRPYRTASSPGQSTHRTRFSLAEWVLNELSSVPQVGSGWHGHGLCECPADGEAPRTVERRFACEYHTWFGTKPLLCFCLYGYILYFCLRSRLCAVFQESASTSAHISL